MKKLLSLTILLLAQAVCLGQSLMFDINGNGIFGTAAFIDRRQVTFTNQFFPALAAGLTDLVTAASDKKILFPSSGSFMGSTNASSSTVTVYVKTNSTYIRLTTVSASTTNANTAFPGNTFSLYPNETIAISNSLAGVNLVLSTVHFSSSIRLVAPRISNLTGGNDTLYTTPAGYYLDKPLFDFFGTSSTAFVVNNNSGGAIVVQVYFVPSGGAVDDTNRYASLSIANAATASCAVPILFEGQSIVLVSNSADTGQSVVMSAALEYPIQ